MKKLISIILIILVLSPIFSSAVKVCHGDIFYFYRYAKVEVLENCYKLTPQEGYRCLQMYQRNVGEWYNIQVAYVSMYDLVSITDSNETDWCRQW